VLRQNEYVKWTDIGMAIMAVILFLAVLAMVSNP
jgi:hypothetical protein